MLDATSNITRTKDGAPYKSLGHVTIFAVKARPPAQVTGCPIFLIKAAELKRFRSHPTLTVHAVYKTLGGWEVFQNCVLSSS